MFGSIKNFAMKVAGAVPVLRNFVPAEKESRTDYKEKTNPIRNNFHFDDQISEQGFYTPIKQKKQIKFSNFDNTIATSTFDVLRKFPHKVFHEDSDYFSLKKSITSNIKRLDNNPGAIINFNQNLIKSEISQLLNHITTNYQAKIEALNKSNVNVESVEKYLNVNKQFLIENVRLALELQKAVLERVIEEPIKANAKEVAKAFTVSKELSQHILERVLVQYSEANPTPSSLTFSIKGQETNVKTYVDNNLKDYIKMVFLGSKFGIHNKELVLSFMDNFSNLDFEDDSKLYDSLLTLTTFQDAIHGSVLQDAAQLETPTNEIAEINEEITKNCLKELLNSINKDFELREDDINDQDQVKELDIAKFNIKNLQNFLKQVGVTELRTYVEAKKSANSGLWSRLGFDPEAESSHIEDIYKSLNNTVIYLGQIYENDLNHEHYQNSVLEVLNDEQAFNKHFRRIVFETQALAAIDAISTYRGRKGKDLSLLEENENFKTIPWLKDFYVEAFDKFMVMMAEDKSVEGTMDVAEELSKLGHQLNKIGLFSSDNFFKRYGIEKLAEQMLEKMGDLTEVGVVAIMIDLYSNLFSYLNSNDENSFMKANEIGRLKRLIKYLRKISTIVDEETGEVLFNPPRPNKYAVDTYNKMAKIIGSKGFLLSETDLILDFFKKAIEVEKVKRADQESYNILDAKHTILATWLLYILIKFLPKDSDNIDSLKARVKVFKTLVNDNLQSNREIPPTLYPKITDVLMGYRYNEEGDKKDRKGIVTELCDEVTNKIHDHINGKDPGISLKELLYVYQDLENTLKNNPNGTKKALQVRKDTFNNTKPILDKLENITAEALETDAALIVSFAKSSGNEQVRLRIANELLNKIADISKEFTKDQNDEIEITDSDSKRIKQFSKILIYSQYLGYLVNNTKSQRITLRASHLLDNEADIKGNEDQINQIDTKIQNLEKLLSKKVLLLKDENFEEIEEAFKNQHQIKSTLIELMHKPGFKLRPSLGNKFEWLSQKKAEKLRENQFQYSMSA